MILDYKGKKDIVLDFSKCKSKEDVDLVVGKHKEFFKEFREIIGSFNQGQELFVDFYEGKEMKKFKKKRTSKLEKQINKETFKTLNVIENKVKQ